MFQKGGCCQPARRIVDHDGQVIRINIGFDLVGLFTSQQQPFNEEDMKHCPPELLQHGLTEDEWHEWKQKFITIITERRSFCSSYLSLLCCFQCNTHRKEVLRTDSRLKEWSEDFNSQCLQSKGMFCKIQSYSLQLRDRLYSHWIAISLTSSDCESLTKERHLFGSVQDWTCCGGVNEHELCCHPF